MGFRVSGLGGRGYIWEFQKQTTRIFFVQLTRLLAVLWKQGVIVKGHNVAA